MNRDFSQSYDIIYDNFIKSDVASSFPRSRTGLARFLGHGHDGKVRAWEKGQWPSAYDCWVIHKKMGFCLEWLLTGEGEMLTTSPQPATAEAPQQPRATAKIPAVPVLGFAACGVIGWSGQMAIPMAATAPHIGPQTIAVMASGESMIPAGIGHGHICYCEPDLEPLRGDIIYVRRHDELGTLKTFLGWGEAAGVPEATKGELCLRGWTDRDEKGQQQELILTVDKALVKTVAPVVFVRRRM